MSVTLPGDIASEKAGPLLRRGAPVLDEEHRPFVVVTSRNGWAWLCGEEHGVCFNVDDVDASFLALDLSDDLGLDTAARWLARHHGLTLGATAPEWRLHPALRGPNYWTLATATGFVIFVDSGRAGDATIIPRISALTNPAEALRLAILHAVGRTS